MGRLLIISLHVWEEAAKRIGLFAPFYGDETVRMVGCEPGGTGSGLGQNAAAISYGVPAIIHGFRCYALLDGDGEVAPTSSIAAGLDYPGIGPEHSFYKATGRAEYVAVSDQEALDAFQVLTRTEGIIPALESAHAVAHAIKLAPQLSTDQIMIVNLSGRGDRMLTKYCSCSSVEPSRLEPRPGGGTLSRIV